MEGQRGQVVRPAAQARRARTEVMTLFESIDLFNRTLQSISLIQSPPSLQSPSSTQSLLLTQSRLQEHCANRTKEMYTTINVCNRSSRRYSLKVFTKVQLRGFIQGGSGDYFEVVSMHNFSSFKWYTKTKFITLFTILDASQLE